MVSEAPWRPDRLAELGYAPYRDMLRTVLRHAGGIRVDHILGLFRLWWVPQGLPASAGAYVKYDHEALVGILILIDILFITGGHIFRAHPLPGLRHPPNDLVPQDQRQLRMLQIPVEDVQVGATNTAGADAHQQLVGAGAGNGHSPQPEGPALFFQHHGSHFSGYGHMHLLWIILTRRGIY